MSAAAGWTPVDEAEAKWTPVQPAQATATVKAAPTPLSKDWWLEKMYNAIDATTKSLPAIGATAGGMIGTAAGPEGTVGGAGMGGMGGEALKQIVRRGLYGEGPATSGEAAQQIAKEGAIQGGIQAATEGLGAAVTPLRNAAVRQYTQALKPTTAENKAIAQDIVPEMIKRGIHGSTEDIEAQAAENISKLRPELNAAYAGVPQSATAAQSPVTSVSNALEKLKGKYVVDGQVVNPSAVDAIQGVQDVIHQYSNSISPQSLRKVKQIFDEAVSEAGGYTTADLATNYSLKAQKVSANEIRSVLHRAGPEAANADKEISFWLDMQQVAKATNLRRAGQEGGLLKTFRPMAAAGAGALGLTQGVEGGFTAAATTYLAGRVAEAMRTPAWRTASAVLKDRLASSLANGDVRMSVALLGRLGAAIPANWASQAQATPQAPTQ